MNALVQPVKCGALALMFVFAQSCFPATSMTADQAVAARNGFDCMILPAQIVEIRSPVVGLIEQVHVQRGASIRKDEVLVTLESGVERSATASAAFRAQAQGALMLATNKLAAARDKAQRYQQLYAEEFMSAQARDDAEAELRLAQAELKTAQENAELAQLEHRQAVEQLNRRVLRSPVTGVVMDLYLYPGSLVDPADSRKPVMKVAQTNVLKVEATVPLQYFPDIRPSAEIMVIPEQPFDRPVRARIKTIDRVIDPAAGTFGVVAEIDNSSQRLPGGIRCKFRLR
jgi:RND family efflux transporter MFP subunit